MKTKMVSYRLEDLPALTDEQRANVVALAARQDADIDFSDIPEMTDERVDADVLEWLKSQGKGYQSRINAVLRREMLASLK